MPGARLELARCRQRWILSPLRLPIPPSRHKAGVRAGYYRADKRNGKGVHIYRARSASLFGLFGSRRSIIRAEGSEEEQVDAGYG